MHDCGDTSLKLLIAEDYPRMQSFLRTMTGLWGFDADIVANGVEAVQRAQTGTYDLCLMDRQMPVMDGFAAVATIRRQVPYFPILMYSSDPPPPQSDLSEKGIDEWIDKFCDPSYLHQKIAEWGNAKTIRVTCRANTVTTAREMPMDPQHAQELRKLKEQGLLKMRLDGPDACEVIVHRNTPNKISHDFNVKKYLMTEFLNRDPERPTVCDLYRGNKNCIVETFLDDKEYAQKLDSENEKMAQYMAKMFKAEED